MDTDELMNTIETLVKLMAPEIDFLPGVMLESNQDALAAVQKAVTKKIKSKRPTAECQWHGTHVIVVDRGIKIGLSEVHGANWKRGTDTVSGIQIDLGFL